METLEQLKEKFNKLDKERGILFKKILELENQETLKGIYRWQLLSRYLE